ncbi:putative xylanase [Lachnospiraceae bacterium KM106-2]|nr:putative xylanase [Lachnospiraceae bacterium KM106-2]
MIEGLENRGNLYRLKKCMKRCMAGEEITLGFIGGSITMGSLSSTSATCYAYLVYKWWVKKFPKAKIHYVNAGIGGTTSQFGVARAESDLLCYRPDFVGIEFSVNDENTDFFKETYEGLVRKIVSYETDPAVMLIHNVRYDGKTRAHQIHTEIGRAYDLPSISMKEAIYGKVKEGSIPAREITPDDLHPNDKGHALVAGAITNFLECVYKEVEQEETVPKWLQDPVTKNRYENSKRYQNYNSSPVLEQFSIDHSRQDSITEFFKKGWTATKEGALIQFEIEGTELAVQYRKTIHKPAPIAEAVIDGEEEHKIKLDANFDEDWGDCLYLQNLASNLPMGKHLVTIRIIESHENDQCPFYLVSLIGSH